MSCTSLVVQLDMCCHKCMTQRTIASSTQQQQQQSCTVHLSMGHSQHAELQCCDGSWSYTPLHVLQSNLTTCQLQAPSYQLDDPLVL